MFKISRGIFIAALLFFGQGLVKGQQLAYKTNDAEYTINGETPSLAVVGSKIYMVFTLRDSIFCSYSTDKGKKFSVPKLVAILKGLVNIGGRGPQIVSGKGQLLIAVPDASGNIYTYLKKKTESSWRKGARINDLADVAKEDFLSLGSNGDGHFFAIWLDVRIGKKNNIYGAQSIDAGKTWLKNQIIYKSPDGSVCDCCKPSVVMKDQQVIVMFRNNLNGNRDFYIIQSKDGGATFGTAQKLGEGSWKLNGCPMDGGGLMIDNNNAIRTIWQRQGNVFSCDPGKKEILISKGRQCAIAGINGAYYMAFISEGKLYCRKPDGKTIQLGSGESSPKLVAIDKSRTLCVWEYDSKIHHTIIYN
jgi:hypothetical protein